MYSLRIQSTGFPEAFRKIDQVLDLVENHRDDMANAALHGVGVIFEQNFKTEGRMTGKPWQKLAERTQRERESLGFPAEHPILIRYGSLAYATSTYLLTAPKQATFYNADPDGKVIGLTVRTSVDTATVYAYGDKAVNQTGGGHLPERPYWFVTNRVMQAARDGASKWLVDEIKRIV